MWETGGRHLFSYRVDTFVGFARNATAHTTEDLVSDNNAARAAVYNGASPLSRRNKQQTMYYMYTPPQN